MGSTAATHDAMSAIATKAVIALIDLVGGTTAAREGARVLTEGDGIPIRFELPAACESRAGRQWIRLRKSPGRRPSDSVRFPPSQSSITPAVEEFSADRGPAFERASLRPTAR